MVVYLVPAAGGSYELYSEVPETLADEAPPNGRIRRFLARVSEHWHERVEAARRGSEGRLGRWTDRAVCAVAESIAEQRTLWALRKSVSAVALFPSSIDAGEARAFMTAELAHARRHHLRWLAVDLVLFILSGVLVVIPGPNLVAYYFAFRLVGHLQSWRGARQAMDQIAWTFTPDPGLAELASLVDQPRETRAPRVAAIAERLNLPHLAAFFDRIAVPSA